MTESVEANPFVGPRPFEAKDSDRFFGRSDEVSELLSLVTAYPVVLLYAQSGAGKTSLLNAGLIPLLAEESFEVLPVARVRGFEPEGIDLRKIPNIYVFNTLIRWAADRMQPRSFLSTSIAAFLKEHEHLTDKQGLELPRVVIFDQFEELFTSYPDRWKEREDFFRQVAEALEADSLLRVLFVIREDYLANLDSYADCLPEQLRTRFRLERLRAKAACQAVEGPLQDTERSFAEGVASRLVRQLLNIRVKNAAGELIEVAGEFVEPVQLQVVCQSLWQNLPSDVKVITSEQLQEFGDVEEALKGFYDRAIEIVVKKTGIKKGDLRKWFHVKLITPGRTRGTVFRGNKSTGWIPNSAVDVLQDQHIIRADIRAGARWYELTHDRLIEPILKANEVWLQKLRAEKQQREVDAERERTERAQRRAEEQARSARRRLIMSAVLTVALLVAVLSAGIAVKYYGIQKDASDKLRKSLVIQTGLTERANELTAQLDIFVTSGIEELKNDPNTKALAERWEADLLKLRPSLPPRTITPEEWQDNLKDLRKLIEAHNELLKKLSSGNLPNDEQTNRYTKEFSKLYDTLRVLEQLQLFFDDTTSIGKDLKELREIIQKIENIRSQSEFINLKNSLPDKVLGEFCKFAVNRLSLCTPEELEKLDDIARRLADFVSDPNWPDKFRMDVMAEEHPLYEKTNLTELDFENWLREVEGYRVLEPDPRQQNLQNQIIQEIRGNIEKVKSYLPGEEKEFQQRLFVYQLRIQKLLEMPAIVKNEAYINNAVVELKDIGERLARLKLDSTPLGIPSWCKRVSIDRAVSGVKYTIAFLSRQLRDKFVPISTSHKRPIEVVQGSYQELLREDFVEEKYQRDSPLNAGWPNYIASSKDPSVILRFIPAGLGNPEPFYMAIHEITCAQYARFLQSYGAIPVGLSGQCKYGAEGRTFLRWIYTDYPPSPIEWTGQTFVIRDADRGNYPVTYVTYDGADTYAKWLGGQLPTASQHKYACKAGTNSLQPWTNDQEIADYAHVRAREWLIASNAYDSKLGSFTEVIKPPLGAIKPKDFIPYKTKLDGFGKDEIVHSYTTTFNSAWPVASAAKPNTWDLYDMIGNVWEWCQGEFICGGSCLAPPEYITNASMYSKSFKSPNPKQSAKANDVGFRVVVPAK